jgi:hypothetical protein
MQTQRGAEWRQANVEVAPYYTNKEVDHLIKEVEVRDQSLNNSTSVYSFIEKVSKLLVLIVLDTIKLSIQLTNFIAVKTDL